MTLYSEASGQQPSCAPNCASRKTTCNTTGHILCKTYGIAKMGDPLFPPSEFLPIQSFTVPFLSTITKGEPSPFLRAIYTDRGDRNAVGPSFSPTDRQTFRPPRPFLLRRSFSRSFHLLPKMRTHSKRPTCIRMRSCNSAQLEVFSEPAENRGETRIRRGSGNSVMFCRLSYLKT
jgi:hypothetical protein